MKPANATQDYSRLVEDILAPEDVHAANTVSEATATNGLFLIFAIILSVLYALDLYLFLSAGVWVIFPILLHFIITGIAAMVTYTQYRRGMDVQHLAIMTIVAATTGLFGTIGALIGYFSTLVLRSRAQHFEEWYSSIFPTDELSESEVIYDQILEGIDENPSNYSVMPFTEVMRLGSENQKRRALAKMTARFSPRFSKAFRLALADSSNTIRVQAATAVAKVERNFTTKLERIELARAKQPKNPMITLALAKFYDDYAFTGVLDPELEKINRERAINTYRSYLQLDPNSSEAWMAVGRLLHRNKQWEEAADWFRRALDRGWQDNSMIAWYFECLFRLGQYRELRRALLEHGRGLVAKEDLPADIRDAVSLWMEVA